MQPKVYERNVSAHDLVSTTPGHGIREKEEKEMVESFLLYQSDKDIL